MMAAARKPAAAVLAGLGQGEGGDYGDFALREGRVADSG
jgi:hypothetical protein